MTEFCRSCGEHVTVKWCDEGIGKYEFWGQRCRDKQMVARCEQCDEEIETGSYANHLAEDAADFLESMER